VLTFIAAHTSTLRLGTGICLVPQRQPVYTAKMVADLDYLSQGRVDFGIGIGWLETKTAAAAGERLRDVSLEDAPSDTPSATHRAAQVNALRRAIVEVTRVLESGAARGEVDASLRGVVATLETAAKTLVSHS